MQKQSCYLIPALSLLLACNTSQSTTSFIHPEPTTIDKNIILPPAWSFGVMYGAYTNQQGSIERVKEIIAHDYPIDAYWIDSWFWDYDNQGKGPKKYIDFIADTIGYPNRTAMWDFFESQHIKGGFWTWDAIMQTGNEDAFKEFDSLGYFTNTYYESNPWHNNSTTTAMFETNNGSTNKGTLCGNINFNDPNAVAHFKKRMKHFFDEGADFIKLDRTAAIPVCKAMFEMSQEFGSETKGRGYVMSHSFGTEDETYKLYPGKWTDDTRADWNIETPTKKFNSWVPNVAFKENIAMYTDPQKKSSQIPFLTQDLGGFDMGITDQIDKELFIRWTQFAYFCPQVEVFSQPENPTANMAYKVSEQADENFRRYGHLRMQLFPYIYSYAHQMRLTGKHMIGKIDGKLYEYLFGNELFVAPVYEQGAITRQVELPAGKWFDYWSGKEYEGGKSYEVAAPLDVIPVFARAGAIIPMREYASAIEKGNNDLLTLDIWPGSESSFELIEDDGTSNDYLEGIYAKTNISLTTQKDGDLITISPIQGSYQGFNPDRNWKLKLHTTSVKDILVNGERIAFKVENGIITTESVQFPKNKEIRFNLIK